ncbi:MAG: M42 family metallopeptidase [Flexilinea sp.]
MIAKNNQILSLPTVTEEMILLLEKLSNTAGVSGNENAVRTIVREEIKGVADTVKTDALGNLIAVKKAKTEKSLKIFVAAHMDEVGFMLVDKESDGIFRFKVIGGIDERALAGKPVQIGDSHAPGVIGACPVHLSTKEERERILSVDTLRIDTGPGTTDIKIGDYGTFSTKFMRMGPSYCGKALDNRIGVATLIQLIKNCPINIELIAAFTVQEEIGLRGAKVAAYDYDPDIAFVIDCTPANDQPAWDGSENTQYKTKVGQGPAIYSADGRTIYDHRLIRYLAELSEQYQIPYQIRQPGPGGTDAGAIHLTKGGIPTVSLSVPDRYAHTAAMIVRASDWEHHYQLMTAALYHINADILNQSR